MWSSDYPHGDSTWPHSQAVIQDNYGYVPEDELQKIVWDNAVEVYGLTVSRPEVAAVAS
jgi:predicted TIM-barrel fold metal-dependent hydrolase